MEPQAQAVFEALQSLDWWAQVLIMVGTIGSWTYSVYSGGKAVRDVSHWLFGGSSLYKNLQARIKEAEEWCPASGQLRGPRLVIQLDVPKTMHPKDGPSGPTNAPGPTGPRGAAWVETHGPLFQQNDVMVCPAQKMPRRINDDLKPRQLKSILALALARRGELHSQELGGRGASPSRRR